MIENNSDNKWAPNRITLEDIIWAYRLFLGREPESMNVVKDKLNMVYTIPELRHHFLFSDEYRTLQESLFSLPFSGNEPPIQIDCSGSIEKLFSHIQNVWEHLGETEPHWSVITADEFRHEKINDTREIFYGSGQHDVNVLFRSLERNQIDAGKYKTCLEYGCGVGRITFWLAKRFEKVHGFDISKFHIMHAEKMLQEAGINNVSLHHIKFAEDIKSLPKVDVVYSVIVLQHNPPPMIEIIINEMLKSLNTGGTAFFQVPTYRLGYGFSLEKYLDADAKSMEMEMHVFPQQKVFDIVQAKGCRIVEVIEDSWAGLEKSARSNTFIVQKTA